MTQHILKLSFGSITHQHLCQLTESENIENKLESERGWHETSKQRPPRLRHRADTFTNQGPRIRFESLTGYGEYSKCITWNDFEGFGFLCCIGTVRSSVSAPAFQPWLLLPCQKNKIPFPDVQLKNWNHCQCILKKLSLCLKSLPVSEQLALFYQQRKLFLWSMKSNFRKARQSITGTVQLWQQVPCCQTPGFISLRTSCVCPHQCCTKSLSGYGLLSN